MHTYTCFIYYTLIISCGEYYYTTDHVTAVVSIVTVATPELYLIRKMATREAFMNVCDRELGISVYILII